jgi:hypothetical protein
MLYVIVVSTISERDETVKRIERSLQVKKIDNPILEVIKERVNSICIYHNFAHGRVLIQKFLVIIAPVLTNFDALRDLYDSGDIIIDFTSTYKALDRIKADMESIKSKARKNNGRSKAEQLARKLSGIHGKGGASENF